MLTGLTGRELLVSDVVGVLSGLPGVVVSDTPRVLEVSVPWGHRGSAAAALETVRGQVTVRSEYRLSMSVLDASRRVDVVLVPDPLVPAVCVAAVVLSRQGASSRPSAASAVSSVQAGQPGLAGSAGLFHSVTAEASRLLMGDSFGADLPAVPPVVDTLARLLLDGVPGSWLSLEGLVRVALDGPDLVAAAIALHPTPPAAAPATASPADGSVPADWARVLSELSAGASKGRSARVKRPPARES